MNLILEFFRRELTIWRVSGIPVRVDYRWFFVLILMTWLTAKSVPTSLIENDFARFGFGFVTTLIFFASILFHEFAHAFAARRENLETREIVLHPFGGLARLAREPETPRAEFRIAVAGPAASLVLAVAFGALTALANLLEADVLLPFFFALFFLNLLLAIFNMFPGYPLDGGRVLRAYLWSRGKSLNEATIMTGRAGQIIAAALVFIGLFFAIISKDFFTGLWTALVGVFLYDAARTIIRQTNEAENVRVEDVMLLPVAVDPDMNVVEFVERVLPMHRRTVFLVARDKNLFGVLLLEDLKIVARDAWHKTQMRSVMRPVTDDYFVETGSYFADAREVMRRNGIGALGVIDAGGQLVGFLQPGRIRRRH